jgi:hypothetical protein
VLHSLLGNFLAVNLGKHRLEFDFKYDGLGVGTLAFNNMSGIGQGGTGGSQQYTLRAALRNLHIRKRLPDGS